MTAAPVIPPRLAEACCNSGAEVWLAFLPAAIGELENRWSLTLSPLIDDAEASCAWVAYANRADGTRAVLKLGMPHMEAEHEIAGLRFWDGDPTVRLLEADEGMNAMLLERCEPGTHLRSLPEPDQDEVIAALLRRLWRRPPEGHPFRRLSEMLDVWGRGAPVDADAGLLRAGRELFRELPRTAPEEVLLATDLHAGNVLQAQREPWLVIDPKPFLGDPAYDATQHLLNCPERLLKDPHGTIGRFADLLGVDAGRVKLWTFARAAAESEAPARSETLARALAPG